MAENKKPLIGIGFLVAFAFVWGIISYFSIAMFVGSMSGRLAPVDYVRPWTSYFLFGKDFLINILIWVIIVLPFISGVGLLIRKNWARILYIACCFAQMFWVLLNIVKDFDVAFISVILLYVCIFSFPIWYLNRPKVKAQFK